MEKKDDIASTCCVENAAECINQRHFPRMSKRNSSSLLQDAQRERILNKTKKKKTKDRKSEARATNITVSQTEEEENIVLNEFWADADSYWVDSNESTVAALLEFRDDAGSNCKQFLMVKMIYNSKLIIQTSNMLS